MKINMSRPPLALLQSFVDIVKAGKLSVAAQQLNLTVSALSHQMHTLETQLARKVEWDNGEIKLLTRDVRGVQPTAAGRKLLADIEAPLLAIHAAWVNLQTKQRPDCLTISVLPSIAGGWLMQRLPSFTEAHPDIQLSLLSSAELVDFERDDVDLAIRHGAGHWPDLCVHHLMDEFLSPLASPELLKRLKPSLGKPSLAKLHQWPLLGDPSERWLEWQKATDTPAPARYVAQFSDTETLHRAALAGMGVALGRLSIAQSRINKGLLVPLFSKRIRSNYSHYLVYPHRSKDKRSVQVFRDWLLAESRASG
jgi:LysR family transcriptional regulator, glycine cleavage system transcriptional activator